MRGVLSRTAATFVVVAVAACGAAGANPGAASPGDGGASPGLDGSPGMSSDGGGVAPDSSISPPPNSDAAVLDAAIVDSASPPLPSLHIDLSQTSVSGISSGAFMAVQFGVAFSSIVRGIGVFAGGPFGCSQGSLSTAESQCQNPSSAPSVTPLVATTKSLASSGAIDDTSHLATERVYIFGGADDSVVAPVVVDATQAYFAAFIPAGSIQYVSRRAGTGHRMPTLAYGGTCDANDAPWIGNCGFDGAGAALAQIYGTLTPAAKSPSGAIMTLAQGDFVANPASHSLDGTAYVYVPTSCANGETCHVHVAFHGCEMQASGSVGSAFYTHAGYNEWADTNHIVVLYPQTIASAANPGACWDWWGYDSAQFDTKSAPQMAMTRAMVAKLASAAGDP